ncbi:DNA translocase FtsK 4TM domain-containing protein [Thiomicrorhabdus sp. zzn3]|uniref:DNA translocase FtsK n=1 Tax=Thiomicrorhabdus sp. zzn3 TaxID=3039775 RepID=UPI00243664EE|nr:DNA translocase FtsK [Thiomicrorhabdus sp. zzn3]MDG6777669.1 DNA translocase FtsK 4TM domain-containing protein [Thiomicrorhabdus sp. zzn3]
MTFKPVKTSSSAVEKIDEHVEPNRLHWLIKDTLVLSCIGLAFFLFIVLFSYEPADPGFDTAGNTHQIQNYGGKTGAWISSMILYVFGIFGFLIPFGILLAGWVTLKIRSGSDMDYLRFGLSLIGLLLLITAGSGLSNLYMDPNGGLIQLPYSAGGVLGYELSQALVDSIDLLGATLFLLVLFAIAFSLLTSYSWLTIIEVTGQLAWQLAEWSRDLWENKVQASEKMKGLSSNKASAAENATGLSISRRQDVHAQPTDEKPWQKWVAAIKRKNEKRGSSALGVETTEGAFESTVEPQLQSVEQAQVEPEPEPATAAKPAIEVPKSNEPKVGSLSHVKVESKQKPTSTVPIVQSGDLPGLDLLNPPPDYEEGFSEEELKSLSNQLEQRLLEFGVTVKVESVQPGPVVTRFEILPAPGVKVSQINNLAKDLARVLSVKSVRVVDVIPGKAFVGIEIPNEQRELVSFREVLASDEFQRSKSPLTVALGKDIAGKPVVADIAKMPHLLVAGTTGAGKSVGVNSMILSLLYKSRPDEVRLIMVDPKMLELSIYEDIPHLLTPVVTDMSDAANALRWCVFEMDRRYQLMAKLGVRNIAGFNLKVQEAIDKGEPLIDPLYQQAANFGHELGEQPPTLEPLPYIVVVVDEFADMIMVVGKEVEQLIARIAQKARAAGIHLILATQRPSVNVITGLIKANIPTRISFMVNTKIDSRTILDQGGAEQLLGMGDMLFLPPGSGSPRRVHGAFMTDEEVHRVAEFIKSQGEPQYLESITQSPAAESGGNGGDMGDAEQDALYDEAAEFVIQGGRVSISSIQRRFKIGYNRAARIVEAMEAAGLVSPMQANGNREVLVPKPQD